MVLCVPVCCVCVHWCVLAPLLRCVVEYVRTHSPPGGAAHQPPPRGACSMPTRIEIWLAGQLSWWWLRWRLS